MMDISCRYFSEKNIPVLGIEPTSNTAEVAVKKGIETVVDFLEIRLAKELASKTFTQTCYWAITCWHTFQILLILLEE